jgi:hypothetical protein
LAAVLRRGVVVTSPRTVTSSASCASPSEPVSWRQASGCGRVPSRVGGADSRTVSIPDIVERTPSSTISSPKDTEPASSPSRRIMAPEESWMAAVPSPSTSLGSVTTPRTRTRALKGAARAAARLMTLGSWDGSGEGDALEDGDGDVDGGATDSTSAASRGMNR